MNKWKDFRGSTASDIIEWQYKGNESDSIINVNRMADELGIRLVGISFKEIQRYKGFKDIVKQNGRIMSTLIMTEDYPIIAYNTQYKNIREQMYAEFNEKNLLRNRQRESIARCLGFLCDIQNDINNDTVYIEYEGVEEYTDFMKKLLIPKDRLYKVGEIEGFAIKALAFEFGVTIQTMMDVLRDNEGNILCLTRWKDKV